MGQRHQLFVIARINGRYRGLAAIHHQWLYGVTALKVAKNTIKVFQCPANRLALKHELRWATRLTEEKWNSKVSYTIKDESSIPFPFTTTSLVLGASLLMPDNHHSRVHVLPFNLPFDGGDNNDGITVFDITDLEHVRQSFVNLQDDELDPEEGLESNARAMTPLSGATYAACYVKEKHNENDDVPMVDSRSLKSAWPEGDWRMETTNAEGETQLIEVSDLSSDEQSADKTTADLENPDIQPTLRSSALAKVVETAIESPVRDLPQIIESASLLSDFYPHVKSKLYADPHIVGRSASARQLLCHILGNESTVDLGPFNELTMDQIMEILRDRSQSSKGLTALNLSGNLNITKEDLKVLLENFRNLEVLYLLDTPHISLPQKVELLKGSNIQLFDSEKLAMPFTEIDSRMDMGRFEVWDRREEPVYGYIKPVIRQMVILSCSFDAMDHRNADGGIDVKTVLKTSGSAQDSWYCIPLFEVNLLPRPLMNGLAQYLRYIMHKSFLMIGLSDPTPPAVAKMLAMPEAWRDDVDSFNVNPICEYIFRTPSDSRSLSRYGGWWKKCDRIVPDEWTLVLLEEAVWIEDEALRRNSSRSSIRYAFVTAHKFTHQGSEADTSPHSLLIEDIEGFLKHQSLDASVKERILEDWKNATTPGPRASESKVCGRLELESLVHALIYPYLSDLSDD